MATRGQQPDEGAVREHLQRVLASRQFVRSKRLQRFLTYIVDAKLAGEQERIQEYAIGLEVFDRGESFDPKADSIVRSEARRLRQRLEEYYQGEGRQEALRIEIPPPGYVPEIRAAYGGRRSQALVWSVAAVLAAAAALYAIRPFSSHAVDPRARELAAKAEAAWSQWTQEGAQQAERFYEEALAIDRGYADAYIGLSRAYRQQLTMGDARFGVTLSKAIAAADQAIELAPESSDAHMNQALNLAFQPDWPGSERAFLRALELDENDALLQHAYAINFLAAMGRLEEADERIRRAVELDPQMLANHVIHGKILYFQGRYQDARDVLEDVIAIKPQYPDALRNLAAVVLQQGELAEAVRMDREAQQLSYLSWGDGLLAHALAASGEREEATEIVRRLESEAERGPTSALGVATAYVGLGDYDAAFGWLEKAWQAREMRMRYLAVDPLYRPLRSDPRFGALLDEMRIPPASR